MAKFASQFLFFSTFLLLSTYIAPTLSSEVDDEKEFNYSENSEHGPSKWGEIHPEWGLCGKGKMQSPVDLGINKRVSAVTQLKTNYKPANATLKNRGHDIMLQWEGGAGSLQINGTEYVLSQVHWHSPSEHSVKGKRFDLEGHLVHESRDKKIAVVGILYTIGGVDPFLASIQEHLESISDRGTNETQKVVGMVDPRNLKIETGSYYRYIGSLTVPPCTQNVLWTVLRKVRTVTVGQVRQLRTSVHDASDTNARPIQT